MSLRKTVTKNVLSGKQLLATPSPGRAAKVNEFTQKMLGSLGAGAPQVGSVSEVKKMRTCSVLPWGQLDPRSLLAAV